VLQEREVEPVGGSGVAVDVRVISATNRRLDRMVEEGSFREDLYYRLGVLTIAVPPLRERGEDVLLLAEAFLARHRDKDGPTLSLTREAREAVLAHQWPGNVRELEHRVQRAVLLSPTGFVTVADLGLGEEDAHTEESEPTQMATLGQARERATRRFERDYLEHMLALTDGSVAEASSRAGVSRQRLYAMLAEHEIDPARWRPK